MNKDQFKANARQLVVDIRNRVVDSELEAAAALFGAARDDDDEDLVSHLSTPGVRNMPFSRRKTFTINTAADKTILVDFTDESNIVKPIPYGETQQPAGERLNISGISIIIPNDLLPNSYKVLQRLGVRLTRADGKVALEMPLAKIMDTEFETPNAGTNTAAVIEGTQTRVKTPRMVTLQGRQALVVVPGDSVTGIQFFKRPDHVAADFVLTAEAALIAIEVEFNGNKLSRAAGKR